MSDMVAVTGGSGFIASHVVDKLISDFSVIVIDRQNPIYKNNMAIYYKLDLLSPDLTACRADISLLFIDKSHSRCNYECC